MPLTTASTIIDTYISIQNEEFEKYGEQLKSDLIPTIRKLQRENKINWFCFLKHACNTLTDKLTSGDCIHVKLSLIENVNAEDIIKMLPSQFKEAYETKLEDISGIDINHIKDKNWLNAWQMLGDASEFAISLLENHDNLTRLHLLNYLHFVSNPLGMGRGFKIKFPPKESVEFGVPSGESANIDF